MGIKIAIDAGHGSWTSGKSAPDGYKEHYGNVKVASYFAKAMTRCNISYIKTGWNDDNAMDDADTSLSVRQRQIKSAKCDYSISFHFNASGNGKTYNSAQGIETLISNKAAGDSLKMANTIHKYLIQGTAQKNRGVKTQSLAICNCSVMGTKASILVECAFMTNEYEESLMKSDKFCNECAEEAAKGFCEYVGVKYIAPNGNITNSASVSISTSTTYSFTDFVKEIQKVIGTTVDGIPGSKTLAATPTVSRKKNNKHGVIKPLQKYLNSIGYNCGTADGIAGAKFDSAVKAFQKANGCVSDGELTATGKSWRKILKME